VDGSRDFLFVSKKIRLRSPVQFVTDRHFWSVQFIVWFVQNLPGVQNEIIKKLNRKGMLWIRYRWIFVPALFIITGCGSGNETTGNNRYDRGHIAISADESFKPVIDSQVQVYEAKYPDVKLNVLYKPEADCIRDLAVDSVKMVIITRRLHQEEKQFIVDSFQLAPEQMLLAFDAIAVIVHPESDEFLFSMNELKEILTGKFRKNLIPVFDGLKATSTVRFIVDSLLRGDSLTSKALAAKSSEEVINYVSTHQEAIGLIGVSWIGNKDDEKQLSFLKKVKLAELESTDEPGKYVQPVQANIYNGRYPLIRELVAIIKEKPRDGLAHGFRNFMTSEKGQLIFRRAYLVPGYMQFIVRPTKLRDE
jgi:phosphate transport system substrate-binding protein